MSKAAMKTGYVIAILDVIISQGTYRSASGRYLCSSDDALRAKVLRAKLLEGNKP